MSKFKKFIGIVCFLMALSFIPNLVFADGMLIKPDPYSDRWDYSNESNQQAFINYANGLQKMIITVKFENNNSDAVVWLFPIPADPNKVAIDVVKYLPHLSGEEISQKVKSKLADTKKFLQMSQLYTIPAVLFYETPMTTSQGIGDSLNKQKNFGANIEQADVVVYEHLEKEGITSEVITAETAAGLYDYLKSNGLKIEKNSIPVLNNYIGKKYSFVISWISPASLTYDLCNTKEKIFNSTTQLSKVYYQIKNKYPNIQYDKTAVDDYHILCYARGGEFETFKQEFINAVKQDPALDNEMSKIKVTNNNIFFQKGIFVTFPTKKIYFPLLPTSVYGSKTVPATIRIIGHVSPKVFPDIKNYTKTTYYIDKNAGLTEETKNFYNGRDKITKYTKIEINAPSKFLTDDLWITNRAPLKTYYPTFVAKHPIANGIILFILSSILAGILAGLIVFKDLRNKPLKLTLIGLSNCLTLLVLLITTMLINTKNINNNNQPLLVEIKNKRYFKKRKIAMLLFFTATPLIISGLFIFPWLKASIINEINLFGFEMKYLTRDYAIPILALYFLPIIMLMIGFIIKKIKAEDIDLFQQLKSVGYSSWSFQPKDKMKIIFVPLFSILFLIISWLLIKLVGIIV